MATKEDLENLTKQLADHFKFEVTPLDEAQNMLVHSDSHNEICRLEIFSVNDPAGGLVSALGVAFQIEIISTDAILIFSKARSIYRDVVLLGSYYIGKDQSVHRNLQAYVMSENDKEQSTKAKTIHDMKIQQIEEWELNKLERSGKLRIH